MESIPEHINFWLVIKQHERFKQAHYSQRGEQFLGERRTEKNRAQAGAHGALRKVVLKNINLSFRVA